MQLRHSLFLLAVVLLASMAYVIVFMAMHSPSLGGLRKQDLTKTRFSLSSVFEPGDLATAGGFETARSRLKVYPNMPNLQRLPALESLEYDPVDADDSITFVSAALDIGRRSHRTVSLRAVRFGRLGLANGEITLAFSSLH